MWVVSSFLPLLISGAKKRLESLFSWWKAAGALCRRLLRKPPLSKTDDFSEIYCNFFRKPDQTAPNLQEFFQIGNDPPSSLLFVKFFWKIMTKIDVFKAKKIAMNLFRSKMNPAIVKKQCCLSRKFEITRPKKALRESAAVHENQPTPATLPHTHIGCLKIRRYETYLYLPACPTDLNKKDTTSG